MKITVINGNARKGSTWHCKDHIVQAIAARTLVELTEFQLPRDMPHFCNGCFACIYHGEQTCPHSSAVAPIVTALTDADLIILTSPVYAMDVSGQMKAMLDHLCYMWLSHRPNPLMFQKIGLTISTTAGAGLGHATKTMRNSLSFWGVKRVFSYKNAVAAMKWSDVDPKKQSRIQKDSDAIAKRIVHAVEHVHTLHSPLFRNILFSMMKGMMAKNTWNPQDRGHWEAQGWLSGVKPF